MSVAHIWDILSTNDTLPLGGILLEICGTLLDYITLCWCIPMNTNITNQSFKDDVGRAKGTASVQI